MYCEDKMENFLCTLIQFYIGGTVRIINVTLQLVCYLTLK